jgi:hypothetical protein
MWLQAVAIILPRVQRHYGAVVLNEKKCLLIQALDVADSQIGVLSASVFAGMMIGAVVWGTCELQM